MSVKGMLMRVEFQPETVLSAQNLTKKYEDQLALDALSFELRKGLCVSLLGPNGAGKTTTCDLLTGITVPDRGSLSFAGLSYSKNRPQILENLGAHLQETQFYGKYTVVETFALFASFYRKKICIKKIIENFSLEKEKDKRLERLSSGQRQRVYLACALVHDPQILILDEPTTALDPHGKHQVWKTLSFLKKQGKSLFLTTHNMEEAQRLSDHVLILDKGKLIAQGSPSELITNICGKDILSFSLPEKSSQIKSKVSWIPEEDKSCYEIASANGQQYLDELNSISIKEQAAVENISVRSANLEDVFLKLTGRNIVNET
jgi:ABC-2 type transport system ATP-binding protein